MLRGYATQTDRGFELIVADDGSTADTGDLVREYKSKAPFECRHVWHDDEGFRAAAIRNQAVVATAADYIVFTDGDCIPPATFVERHRALAERGWFVAGNRLGQVAIDLIRFSGPDLQHINNHLMNLELVRKGLADAVMFGPDQSILTISEELFQKSVIIQRGTYRPVTKTHVDVLDKGIAQFISTIVKRIARTYKQRCIFTHFQ